MSQHFRISFAGMLYAGRSYHLAAKGSRYLQRAMQVLVTGMIFYSSLFIQAGTRPFWDG